MQGRFVRLEPLSRDHLAGLRAIVEGWPRERHPFALVPTLETLDAYVEQAMTAPRTVAFATCRADGGVVGCTRFFDLQQWDWPRGLDPRPGHVGYDACEIGYTWLAPEAQRTPVNTEAKLLMLRHAFETWGCFRVQLKTDERNAQSRAAIERIGGKLEGILRANQPAADGTPRNSAYYSILASEWPTVRQLLDGKVLQI